MKIVTLNKLHGNIVAVMRELNETQEPFVLTRHGRMLAMITPLPSGIESQLIAKYLEDQGITQ